jgi:hypothetical protein
MSIITTLQGHRAAALAAQAAGDWATALAELIMAETCLVGVPDDELGGDRMEWGRDLRSLKASVLGQQASGAGIQRARITYTATSD